MERIKIYHTVEDTGKPELIEKLVPFRSASPDCWAGQGYYFWERYIMHAHRWGNIRYVRNKKKYVICGSYLNFSKDNCFNLIDLDHLDYLTILKESIKNQMNIKECSFENIIKYARKYDLFPFKLIRMAEVNQNKLIPEDQNLIELRDGNRASFLSLKPRIVLFVENLDDLEFDVFKIEFPDEYVRGYVA